MTSPYKSELTNSVSFYCGSSAPAQITVVMWVSFGWAQPLYHQLTAFTEHSEQKYPDSCVTGKNTTSMKHSQTLVRLQSSYGPPDCLVGTIHRILHLTQSRHFFPNPISLTCVFLPTRLQRQRQRINHFLRKHHQAVSVFCAVIYIAYLQIILRQYSSPNYIFLIIIITSK